MIRILQVVPNMNMGGLESFIMNVYRNIDRNKIQFDFIEHYKQDSFFDEEIIKLGGKIYHFSFRNDKNIFKYILNLNSFFKKHKEYKIIHCHMESIGAILFIIAKLHGIKILIGHAHTSSTDNNLKGVIKRVFSKLFKYFTKINFACSTEAGEYLFGCKKYEVIPNAIELSKFKYKRKNRKELRKKYNIENKFVIGHIGRMDKNKNQLFLIDVFNDYLKFNPNSCLVLVGDGEERKNIIEKINNYGIADKVLLLGVKKEVDKIYSMFDLFVFPSLYEGLGIVLIEAQINGLKCITNKDIPKECVISNKIYFLDINDKSKWVKKIIKCSKNTRGFIKYNYNKNNYDITLLAKYMENKYLKLYSDLYG